jgi:hypothetical protein
MGMDLRFYRGPACANDKEVHFTLIEEMRSATLFNTFVASFEGSGANGSLTPLGWDTINLWINALEIEADAGRELWGDDEEEQALIRFLRGLRDTLDPEDLDSDVGLWFEWDN